MGGGPTHKTQNQNQKQNQKPKPKTKEQAGAPPGKATQGDTYMRIGVVPRPHPYAWTDPLILRQWSVAAVGGQVELRYPEHEVVSSS